MAGSKEVTARAVSCRCDCLEGARDNNDWHKLREIGGEVGGQRWWMSMIDNGWWKLSLLWVIAAAAPAADDGSGGDDYDAIFTLNPWYELSNSTDQTFKFKHWDQQELQDSRPGDEVFYLMNGWFSISGGKACLKHRQKVQSDHKWLHQPAQSEAQRDPEQQLQHVSDRTPLKPFSLGLVPILRQRHVQYHKNLSKAGPEGLLIRFRPESQTQNQEHLWIF